MKKGRRVSQQAATVREVHGLVMDSLNSYLGAISVQDLLNSLEQGVPTKTLIAEALRTEATRLEEQAK